MLAEVIEHRRHERVLGSEMPATVSTNGAEQRPGHTVRSPTPQRETTTTRTPSLTASATPPSTTTATVTVTANPVNDVVVASDRSVSMSEDGGLSSVVSTSLTDVDDDHLTASVVGQPAHGTVEFDSAANYKYSPAPNYTGTDSFTYRLFNGTAYSNTATVTITHHDVLA